MGVDVEGIKRQADEVAMKFCQIQAVTHSFRARLK
jgi:hypothetical protein